MLLLGVVLAVGLAGLAVVTDDPLILALAAAVAFVAVGYVMPARGLPLLIVQRQRRPLGVAGAAFLFAFLGIWLVWASTTALDATLPSLQLTGWLALVCFSLIGVIFVAALRCAEDLNAGPVKEPKP